MYISDLLGIWAIWADFGAQMEEKHYISADFFDIWDIWHVFGGDYLSILITFHLDTLS